MQPRNISQFIKSDLKEKIVLMSGPRQVGKTTLAQSLSSNYSYWNYDVAEHRPLIMKMRWPKDVDLVILDELHKMKDWKRWLKGIYDLKKTSSAPSPAVIVTGSARLDIARKMGDSLAGRHFSYRLNPLTIKELGQSFPNTLDRMMRFGGFPEPFLEGRLDFYRRWQTTHLDLILRQDLLDMEQIRQISQIETLVELLRHKVGTPCSYSSLAEDLQVDHTTVKRWITALENLFVIFKVLPHHRNVARAILRTPKYYFYDLGRVPDNKGARFENLVALALISEVDFIRDTQGRRLELSYLRNKQGREIDFLVSEEKNHLLALESKWSEEHPDSSFRVFFGQGKLSANHYVQLVGQADMRKEFDFGLKIEPASLWLEKMPFY